MSGGYFDYMQDRINHAADEVEKYIQKCESAERDEYDYKPEYSAETVEKFRECERALRRAAAMLQRVDWLASGDDGEECFHKRWADEVPSA